MKEKTKFIALFVSGLLSIFSCGSREDIISNKENIIPKKEIPVYSKYFVPVAGNSFIIAKSEKTAEIITDTQLGNWINPNTIVSTYFRVSKSGKLNIGIRASVPNEKTSVIKISVNSTEKEITLKGTKFKEYDAGEFQISTPGYVKVDIQGIEKTGGYFADVTDITFSGEAATGENIFATQKTSFKDVRKGPSSDIYFTLPKDEVNYFYSESTIVEGDTSTEFVPLNFNGCLLRVSSGEGKNKVIIFNVDNNFSNDPKKIPETHKTLLISKGENVSVYEFGTESFVINRGELKYNWKIGETYKFLVKIKPDGKGNIDYTAWFQPSNEKEWKLIVSFKKQKTELDPKSNLYSFLENANPKYGHLTRKVKHENLWVRTKNENWIPITEANFNSYNHNIVYKQRTDAFAKASEHGLLLKNGGFFNDIISIDSKLSIPANALHPDIDFANLPK